MRPRRALALPVAFVSIAVASCNHDGTEVSPLPVSPVEIVVDDQGVPHIYAKSDADAWFGAGYQTAVDRLYQMEMMRVQALGRVSEVIGERGLERDTLARAFDLRRHARDDAAATRAADPERASLVRAWVAGINARVDEVRSGRVARPYGFRREELDFLPERWDDDDPYVVLKGANLVLDRTIEFELAVTLLEAVYPDAMRSIDIARPSRAVFGLPPEDRPVKTPGAAPRSEAQRPASAPVSPDAARRAFEALGRFASLARGTGSNNWAVDGRFTASGRPLVAGDPHLSFDSFGAPYPLHIDSKSAGGTYDVAGFAYPGTPGIALGHTRKVAWTATSAFADVTDVWQVARDGDGVRVGDRTVPIQPRTERIVVRDAGARAGVGRVEAVDLEDVPGYGVLLPGRLLPLPIGGPYLVAWTGFRPRPARWFMELNRVESLDDFDAAVLRMREMTYNFVAADATGIAYRVGVEVPLRDVAPGREPWRAMDGADPKSYWTDARLSAAQLPHSRARARGWIATANNDPLGFTADGRPGAGPFYYGAFFDPGYRASRIESELARLTRRGGLTVDDMRALQLDARSPLADGLVPMLTAARERAASDPALADLRGADVDEVAGLLAAWDRRMVRDARAALVFQAYLRFFASEALERTLQTAYGFATRLQVLVVFKVAEMVARGDFPAADKFLLGGRDAVLLRAARRTAAWLVKRFGSVAAAPPFGALKATSFDGAFGYALPVFALPSDGGEDTVQVAQQISFAEDATTWETSYVSVERSIATFGDDGVPDLWMSAPMGNESDPGAPGAVRAADDYVNGRYTKLHFRRAEVDAHARKRVVLPSRR
jgi:penicillin amidase